MNYEDMEKRTEAALKNPMWRMSPCGHCFCGEGFWNGKLHMVCCMCGSRKLKLPE